MIAQKTKSKKQRRTISPPALTVPFLMIPTEDLHVVRSKGAGLLNYWLGCWEADPYGSRWVLTDNDTNNRQQRRYRKQLSELGLFLFELRGSKGKQQVWTINLHGSRVKAFWQNQNLGREKSDLGREKSEVTAETQSGQSIENSSITPQQHLNNVSKTGLRCCDENISRAWGASEFSGGEKQPSDLSEAKSPTQSSGQNPNLVGEDKCSAAESDQKTEIKPGSLAAQILSRMQKWQLDWDSISPEQKHLRIVKRVVEEVFSHRRFKGSERLERELTAILESLELPLVRLFRHSFLYLQKQRPGAPVIDLINQALSGTGKQIQGADL